MGFLLAIMTDFEVKKADMLWIITYHDSYLRDYLNKTIREDAKGVRMLF